MAKGDRLTRQLQEERAVGNVREAVLRMKKSDDIVDVVRVIWEEMEGLGYSINQCHINIYDEEHDFFGSYYVWLYESGNLPVPSFATVIDDRLVIYSVEFPLSAGGGPYRKSLLEAWRQGKVFKIVFTDPEVKARYAQFVSQHHKVTPPRPEDLPDAYGLWIPYQYGHFGLASLNLDPEQFNEDDITLFSRFGDAFAGGYTRLLEMREKQIEAGVEHLRAEVASMRRSGDIVQVVVELARQLESLGVPFHSCSVSVVDEEEGLVRIYACVPKPVLSEALIPCKDISILSDLSEVKEPIGIEDISEGYGFAYTVEPIAGSPVEEEHRMPPRVVRRNDEEAEIVKQRLAHRWGAHARTDKVPRSVIRVPFSQGSVAVGHMDRWTYTGRDVELAAAFAEALSLGFTRYLDFQRLERQNRELQIERAVGKVQSAVQAMKSSSDLVRVILLLGTELENLGLSFMSCSINVN